jgi:SecD/SecF fusion protein
LLLDRRAEKGLDVSFGFKWNENTLKGANFDFVGNRRKFYLLSGLVIAAGVAAFVMKGGINTGIDFKGGNAFILQFDKTKNINVGEMKEALDAAFPKTSNEIKTFGSEGQYRVVTTHLLYETGNVDPAKAKAARDQVEKDVLSALSKYNLQNIGSTGSPVLSRSSVGAAIATSTRNKSAVLVLLAIVGIFIYIVFRFRSVSYGLGATVALIHDVLVVLSCFAILDGVVPFPTDFDQNLVIQLTIP